MEKSSQSFIFVIQHSLHILTLVVSSCSSQSCQASRHGFVALAMSSWALSNSPKRFAAPGGCRKLYPLHAGEFPWSLLSLLLLFYIIRIHLICFLLSLQSIQSISLSSPVTRCHFPIFLSNWVKGYWTVCACAERPVAEHIDHVEISKYDFNHIERWYTNYECTNVSWHLSIYSSYVSCFSPSCRSSCASLSLRSWERKSHQAVELRLRAKSGLTDFALWSCDHNPGTEQAASETNVATCSSPNAMKQCVNCKLNKSGPRRDDFSLRLQTCLLASRSMISNSIQKSTKIPYKDAIHIPCTVNIMIHILYLSLSTDSPHLRKHLKHLSEWGHHPPSSSSNSSSRPSMDLDVGWDVTLASQLSLTNFHCFTYIFKLFHTSPDSFVPCKQFFVLDKLLNP